MVRLIVFIIVSAGLIIWSWKLLWNRQVHGFYRFFAFESILALVLVNIINWFNNPFSVVHIISWILLISSIVMSIQGFYLLHKIGRPKQGIEQTTVLVKSGIYKYIRHPLYGSLILLTWGTFLKDISLLSAGLSITATVLLTATAIVEEQENLRRFGDEYANYMHSSKRFIPFII